ncbi:MAG: hypothetical protein JEZ09_01325 [Salinivirgaceae bacterium]|nr:hypothetical protein [Salinivirgaceae bacterium]
MQILVSIIVLAIVMGGLFLITLSRGEGKELKKSCACAIPTPKGEKGMGCGCS